jgi:ABC-2 type transport system permease protein
MQQPTARRVPPSSRSTLARWRFNIRIYRRLILLQLRMFVEYRGDFWIGIVGAVLTQGFGLVFISAILSRIPSVNGWTFWEIAMLFGFTLMAYGARELLCDGPWMLRRVINFGDFDRIMVRPISIALQTATLTSSIHGSGTFLLGLVIFLMACGRTGIEWTIGKVLWVVVAALCGLVIVSCVAYLTNMIGFWEPSTSSAFPFMITNLIDLTKFPIEIYGWFIRIGLTAFLPFAFVNYYPTLVLLEKDSPVRWLGYLTPLVAVGMIAITAQCWRRGINRYQGVGH